ncbi:MAG: helix-turn-helix transcriptional regulator, partial [Bryobacteraceae bacterium]
PRPPQFKNPVRHIRNALGFTQPQFAKFLGVSASYIEKLELGERLVNDSISTRIALAVGVFPDSLKKKRGRPRHFYPDTEGSLADRIQAWRAFIEPVDTGAEDTFAAVSLPKLRILTEAAVLKAKGLTLLALLDGWIEKISRELGLQPAINAALRNAREDGRDIQWSNVVSIVSSGRDAEIILVANQRAATSLERAASARNTRIDRKAESTSSRTSPVRLKQRAKAI